MDTAATHGQSDRDLMDAVARRDEAALRVLYDRYGGLLITLALRLVGDRATAEEVLQDVFVRCWFNARTYSRERGSVAGWLMGMTRNRAIDQLRESHAQRRDTSNTVPLDGMNGMGREFGSTPGPGAELADVRSAMAGLTTEQRTAVALALYGGLTQSEIAEKLGVPLGTIKSRIRAGMQRLRAELAPAGVRHE